MSVAAHCNMNDVEVLHRRNFIVASVNLSVYPCPQISGSDYNAFYDWMMSTGISKGPVSCRYSRLV